MNYYFPGVTRLPPSPVIHCRCVSAAILGPLNPIWLAGSEPHEGLNRLALRLERPPRRQDPLPYLNGMLELLVLSLELLCLLQRAGCDEPGIQHRLSIADPAQHLERHTGSQSSRPPHATSPWTHSDQTRVYKEVNRLPQL